MGVLDVLVVLLVSVPIGVLYFWIAWKVNNR